jgi:hypothetical protein
MTGGSLAVMSWSFRKECIMSTRTIRRQRRHSPQRDKVVHVNRYQRWRFERWEDVCEHYRSLPGQLVFDFYV